jgi:tRNA-specific adenosine deaminase 1
MCGGGGDGGGGDGGGGDGGGGDAAAVAAAALAAFAALPRTGKPAAFEHTVLAAVALTLPAEEDLARRAELDVDGGGSGAARLPWPGADGAPVVIALATGTKCLPAERRCPAGAALADCHAEALARRALLRWAYAESRAAAAAPGGATRAFVLDAAPGGGGGRVARLRPGARLHLFVSRPPCGDAAILGLDSAEGEGCDGSGAGRTGAKPLVRAGSQGNGGEFARLPAAREVESYAAPQALGVARRKPGRGAPTASLSCSDKLARWALLGASGALLGALLAAPLRLATLAVGVPEPPPGGDYEAAAAAVAAAAERAVARRAAAVAGRLPPRFAGAAAPAAHAVRLPPGVAEALGLAAGGARAAAAGASVTWWAPPSPAWRRLKPGADGGAVLAGGTLESVAGGTGLLAGRAAPQPGAPAPPAARSALCRAALFAEYRATRAALMEDRGRAAPAGALESYAAAKAGAGGGEYRAAWRRLRAPPSPFEGWVDKPASEGAFFAADCGVVCMM